MKASSYQSSRFEFKYVVSDRKADAIRESIRPHLVPDAFTPKPGVGYAVNTLYLDSAGLDLCNATVQGRKNRFKLRLRWYAHASDQPVFFEIKRRVNDQILKQRVAIQFDAVSDLLAGHLPDREHLFARDKADGLGALNEFCRLRNTIQAKGAVYVRYEREAWVPDEHNLARVTFDRALEGSAYNGSFDISDIKWASAQPRGTILELKFTDRFPGWMRRLVQDFGLERRSFPKYVSCASGLSAYRNRLMLAYGETA